MTKTPKWVKSIPQSQSHGSGALQKRLWRVTSDAVRLRDFYSFGTYVDTGKKIPHWTASQAGHWKSYATCNGLFKFDVSNIHAQSATGNGWGGQEVGHYYGEELKRRYGANIHKEITEANRDTSLKFTTAEILFLIVTRLNEMEDFKEQPEYYSRVMSQL